jgi:predicted oxidoreductase (fatty acid repression mutant protein)
LIMSDVFISYSRVDEVFARKLCGAIEAHGREAWIDWQDIKPTAEWWREIERGIEGANTFVFVLSPDSVASKVCRDEIDHAMRHNKRLVAIVYRDGFELDRTVAAHGALGKLQWLFCRDSDSFEQALQHLIAAVEMDLIYVQEHTRLLQRALEWDGTGRSDSKLLRGDDLVAAERWLQVSAQKEPLPTEQQQNYIGKGREVEDAGRERDRLLIEAKEKAEQRIKLGTRILGGTIVGAIVVGIVTVFSFLKIREDLEANQIEVAGNDSSTLSSQLPITSLVNMMDAAGRLQDLVKQTKKYEYLTSSPMNGLQILLDQVQNQTLLAHQDSISSVEFSPQGDRIVTASWDNTARVWDLSGKLIAELKGHQGSVFRASFSPQGDRIVTASIDNTARVWDLSGKLIVELKGNQGIVFHASFSPQGDRIVTASRDNTARVWDLSGKLIAELKGHQGSVFRASFSPQGDRIVTASWDKTARVWDLSGKTIAELKGHQGEVTHASFNPQGDRVVTASDDGTARIWDLSGNLIAELKGHQDGVINASFNPQGDRILTASADGTARIWKVETLDELLDRGCQWLHNYLATHPEELEKLETCKANFKS